jgi:hypothetical protein
VAYLFHAFDGELTISHTPNLTPLATDILENLNLEKDTEETIRAQSTLGIMPTKSHPFVLSAPAEYNDNQSAIMGRTPDPTKVYQNYPEVISQYPKPVTGAQVYPDKHGIQITYWVFDSYGNPNADYLCRYPNLTLALGNLGSQHTYGNLNIIRLPYVYIPNTQVLQAYEELCLARGFEGVIVRKPKSPYKFGRSTVRQLYLGKIKRFDDAEARIIDFEEQLENTNTATIDARGETERSHHKANMKPKNTLGKLICEHPDFGVIAIGTGKGLTHALRQEIWNNQSKYLGRICKFKYFPIGMKDKPRLPIFLGFRSPQDI